MNSAIPAIVPALLASSILHLMYFTIFVLFRWAQKEIYEISNTIEKFSGGRIPQLSVPYNQDCISELLITVFLQGK